MFIDRYSLFRSYLMVVLSTIISLPLAACRFNVRDIGFIDFGHHRYNLILCHDQDLSASGLDNYLGTFDLYLENTNVLFEVVDMREKNPTLDPQIVDDIRVAGIDNCPALLLRAPDGRITTLPWQLDKGLTKFELARRLTELTQSPLRSIILKILSETYAVVLIIEGDNLERNQVLQDMVDIAVKTITNRMSYLPKLIENPPQIITLPPSETAAEEYLLWSLGLDHDKPDNGFVTILYGKGRRLGRTLPYLELNTSLIERYLGFIGADCECTLDRTWLRGHPILYHWTDQLHRQTAANLGFDPEDPVIKMEVSQILGREIPSNPYAKNNHQITDMDFGYREIAVNIDSPQNLPSTQGKTDTEKDHQSPASPSTLSNQETVSRQTSKAAAAAPETLSGRKHIYITAAIVLAILTIGGYIYHTSTLRRN